MTFWVVENKNLVLEPPPIGGVEYVLWVVFFFFTDYVGDYTPHSGGRPWALEGMILGGRL